MKHIRIFIAAFALFVGLGAAVPAVTLAATPKATACTALGSNAACTTNPHGGPTVNKLIATTVNILSWVVGVAAVIMVILGGFRFITAGGDSNNIASARNTVLYALIGIAIAATAQGIVQFVLNKL